MELRIKILIGSIITLILVSGIWAIHDIRKEIKTNQEAVLFQLNANDQMFKEIFKFIKINNQTLEYMSKTDEGLLDITKKLNKKIDNIPIKIQLEKSLIEYKLRLVIVKIINKTRQTMGSGVTIKYKDKYYILSAGHIIDSKDDILVFSENENEIGELKIIKWDFTAFQTEDFTKGNDLLLLQPKNELLQPKFYVELADFEPQISTEVYVVGNPMGIEDVVSEGRIAIYKDNFMYLRDGGYFGSSGGGVFTLDGKLIGIYSHVQYYKSFSEVPPFELEGAARRNTIVDFLGDINDNQTINRN